MNILLVNDDGIESEGLRILYNYFKKEENNVYVIAPNGNRSNSSHSFNLTKPISFENVGDNMWVTDGTPVDCVRLSSMLHVEFDLLVAGINNGHNLGTDCFYSGTVAQAREGMISGIPSIAISMDKDSYDIIEGEIDNVFTYIFSNNLHSNLYYLNVNFPYKEFKEPKGIRITRQGLHIFRYVLGEVDGGIKELSNNTIDDKRASTDIFMAHHGYITITPLSLDTTEMTAYLELKKIN